jgi:hypothetical protein
MTDLRVASERDGVSMNGFIVQAVAEKVASLRARGLLSELTPEEQTTYLRKRAAGAQVDRFAEIIAKAGTTNEVLPGDEIPEGYWDEQPQADLKDVRPGALPLDPAGA